VSATMCSRFTNNRLSNTVAQHTAHRARRHMARNLQKNWGLLLAGATAMGVSHWSLAYSFLAALRTFGSGFSTEIADLLRPPCAKPHKFLNDTDTLPQRAS
jgi:hypothetical protein